MPVSIVRSIRRSLAHFASVAAMACTLGLLAAAPAMAGAGGNLVWQRSLPVTGKQEARAAAVDSGGNLIVTGYQTIAGSDDAFQTSKYLANGSGMAWGAPRLYNHGTGSDRATAVAVDGSDNVIVVGTVWNGANYDVRTIKYAPDGSELWAHTYASSGHDQAVAVATAANGTIFVGGYQTNSGNGLDDMLILKYPAGGGTPQVILYDDPTYGNNDRLTALTVRDSVLAVAGTSAKSGGDFDLLALKYDLNGTLLWSQRRSSTGAFADHGAAVAVNGAGDLFVTGVYGTDTHKDIYLGKFTDAAPNHLAWEKTYDGGFDDEALALTLDPAGNPVVTGYTWTPAGKFDLFAAKHLATTGALVWQSIINSSGDSTDIGRAVYCDAVGNVYTTGRFELAGNKDLQTLKLAADTGAVVWQQFFNGSGNRHDEPVGIFPGAVDSVLVAGWSDTGAGVVDQDFLALSYGRGDINRPTGLTAQAVSNTAIQLNWQDNAPNEAQFIIERKLGDSGTWQQISTVPATLPANTITYTDGNLVTGNYYFYRVRSVTATGSISDASDTAQALALVIAFDAPAWSYTYGSPYNRNDEAVAIAVGPDDHPVVTGYSDLDEEGLEGQPFVNSYDYLTMKLERGTMAELWSPRARHDSGSGGTDMAAALVVDRNNDVYVAGNSYLAVTNGDIDSMFTLKYPAGGGPVAGSDQVNGPAEQEAYARSIATAVDGGNNLAVAGYFKRTPTNDDIQVVKYTPAMVRAWPGAGVATFDGGGNDQPSGVAFDSAGNLFVTGYTYNLSAGNYDFYTAKYDGLTGALIWSDRYDGPGNGDDQAVAIAVDAEGNAYVTGLVSASNQTLDYLTIKYDGAAVSSRRRIWESRHSGPAGGNDEPTGIRIDPIDGAVVVAGTSVTNPGDGDLHLIRYQGSDGALVWQRTVEQPASDDRAAALAVDSSGYISIAGTLGSGAGAQAVVLRYDHEGNFLGASRYGTASEARAVVSNYRGETFVAGTTRQPTLDNDYLVFKQTGSVILVPAPFTVTPNADSGKLDLGWRQNTAGTSFRLERTPAPLTVQSVWSLLAEPASGTLTYQDSGLNPNAGYCYRISAFTGSVASRKIVTCAVTTYTAPILLPLTPDSTSQVTVAWQEVPGASGYLVERSPTGLAGSWTTVATPTSATSVADGGLAAGSRYYYRVSVRSASGAYSLPSAMLDTYTKPAAPVLNVPASITSTQIGITWPAVTGAGSYTVAYRNDAGTMTDFPACTASAAVSCTVTGLTENTRYHFQVTAFNAVSGASAPSTPVAAYTLLTQPSGLTPTPGSGQISLAWVDNSEAESAYYVEESICNTTAYSPADCQGYSYLWGGWTQVAGPLAAGTMNYLRSELVSGYYYKHRVRAYASSTNVSSAYSSESLSVPHLTPNTVQAVEPLSITSLFVSWSAVTGATSYALERKQGVEGAWTVVPAAASLGSSILNFNDENLQEQTEYCYRVKATNSITGNSVYSSNERCRLTPLPAPVPTAVVTGSATVTINWGEVTNSTGYQLERSADIYPNAALSGYWDVWTSIAPALSASTLTYDDSGLQAGYTYRYRIRDTFGAGDYSAWSNPVVVTTVPRAPAVTSGTQAPSTDQINVQWEDVPGETGYLLQWKARVGSDCSSGDWSTAIAAGGANNPNYSHAGRAQGTWYCYQVMAQNANGQSAFGTPLAQVTLLPPPSLSPISAVTANSLLLSWSAVDNNGGYVVERSGDGVTFTPLPGIVSGTSFTDTGLVAGTPYYYQLRTLNAAAVSSVPSNMRSVVTTPAAPPLTAAVVSSAEVSASWPVVQGATEYRLYLDGSPTPAYTLARAYGLDYCGNSYPTVICTTQSTPIRLQQRVTGLAANSRYCLQLRAWNSTGNESTTSEQCVTTGQLAIPGLTATPLNSFQVRLDWTNGTCAPVACTSPDQYELERETAPGKWWRVATLPAGTYTLRDATGIAPSWTAPDGKVQSTRYKYRLRTVKGGERSPYAEVEVTMPLYVAGDNTCP